MVGFSENESSYNQTKKYAKSPSLALPVLSFHVCPIYRSIYVSSKSKFGSNSMAEEL
jgi:hypothetical protein